jgi:hypothetical protein
MTSASDAVANSIKKYDKGTLKRVWRDYREDRVHEFEFDVSVKETDGVLFVTLRAPDAAPRTEIHACIFMIAAAFASVEQLDAEEMHELFCEQKRALTQSQSVVITREFTDPDYPRQFDLALRSLTNGAEHAIQQLH